MKKKEWIIKNKNEITIKYGKKNKQIETQKKRKKSAIELHRKIVKISDIKIARKNIVFTWL